MTDTFQELNLNSKIIKAITDLGYERPTAVQQRIIPTLLNDTQDIVCLAQTGTGKTAAFGLPVLEKIEPECPYVQVLVLCPTRELCRQIAQDLKNYARYIENLNIVSVYGGAGIEQQIKLLQKNPQIIVATPGRMLDLLKRGATQISRIRTLVLDEADEMLNMGFKEELDAILENTPEEKRVLLFSATLPIEVEKIAKNYMKNAELVTVGTRNAGSDNVKHYYFVIHEKDRYTALKRITDYFPDIYGIIFCRTRKETQDIADALIRDGYDADALHGDLSQQQRDQVMGRFKNKNLQLLVATDVAARGIDVNNLTHVINYNLPDETEQYTHRSGRTGRADKSGQSIVLINSKEQYKIKRIEKVIGKTFAKAKIPTGKEVCAKQLLSLIDQIDNVQVNPEIEQYMPLINERWQPLGREDIIRKFMSMEFNRYLDYYRDAPDLNMVQTGKREDKKEGNAKNGMIKESGKEKTGRGKERKRAKESPSGREEKGLVWIKMTIGSANDLTPRRLLRMMSALGVGRKGIGRIEIRKEASYIQISERAAEYVAQQTDGSEYRGKKIKTSLVKKDR